MQVYNKLVRDTIPNIIEETGKTPIYRTLMGEEYLKQLHSKLTEEVQEYLEARNVEELADIMEVLFALAKLHGASEEQLMKVRQRKFEERGGFEKRIYLEKVSE